MAEGPAPSYPCFKSLNQSELATEQEQVRTEIESETESLKNEKISTHEVVRTQVFVNRNLSTNVIPYSKRSIISSRNTLESDIKKDEKSPVHKNDSAYFCIPKLNENCSMTSVFDDLMSPRSPADSLDEIVDQNIKALKLNNNSSRKNRQLNSNQNLFEGYGEQNEREVGNAVGFSGQKDVENNTAPYHLPVINDGNDLMSEGKNVQFSESGGNKTSTGFNKDRERENKDKEKSETGLHKIKPDNCMEESNKVGSLLDSLIERNIKDLSLSSKKLKHNLHSESSACSQKKIVGETRCKMIGENAATDPLIIFQPEHMNSSKLSGNDDSRDQHGIDVSMYSSDSVSSIDVTEKKNTSENIQLSFGAPHLLKHSAKTVLDVKVIEPDDGKMRVKHVKTADTIKKQSKCPDQRNTIFKEDTTDEKISGLVFDSDNENQSGFHKMRQNEEKGNDQQFSSSKEKPCILYVKIIGKIKKNFNVTGFISTRLPEGMQNFQILELIEDRKGNTIAVVKFSGRNISNRAFTEINKRNKKSNTKVYAFKHRQDAESFKVRDEEQKGKFLTKHINQIADRAQTILTEHAQKLKLVKENVERINVKIKKQRSLSLEQFQVMDSERQAFIDKKEELENQKKEFQNYLGSMHSKIEEISNSDSSKFEREISMLRKAFGVECLRLDNALPMYARRSNILTIIKENQVSVILGETGSGKSTQLPQYIHQAGYARNGLIVCTQPRKVAAVSLATRVAAEMASSVGQSVGYQVGLKIKKNCTTEILYVTDHVLLNECLKDELLSKYSCIIVDEAHERSIYTDLLLGMIKKCLRKRPELRVVITSATINPDVFVRFFGNCPVLRVSGRMFPVEVVWNNSEVKNDVLVKYENLAVEKAVHVHSTEAEGGILVFLTSPVEVERCCQSFGNLMAGRTDFLCLQLHGKLQADVQQKVFQPAPNGKRKVVFATNSAETSITIPEIRYVIDTGLAKEMQFDPKRSINSLNTTMITKSSAEQRKGRAGRTIAGKCFRLYAEEDFEQMRPNNVPEILRIHLGHAILKLMELGVDPLEFDFVESPASESLEAANESLKEIGAINNREITDIGKWIARLPVDPTFGVFIYEGVKHNVCFESMIIAACTASGSIFFRAGTNAEIEKADRLKVRFCQPGGDLMTMLAVFREWHVQPEKKKGTWCFENSINGKAISGVRETVNEIRNALKHELDENIKFEFSDTFKVEAILRELIFRVLKSNICHYLGHQKAGYLVARKDQLVQMHPSSALLPLGGYPEWIVFQQVLKTSREYALVITPVSEEMVEKAVTEGWLQIDIEKTKERKLVPVFTDYVGMQLFREFVGPRYTNLKKLEEELKNNCDNSLAVIEADRERGVIKVYSSKKYEKVIVGNMKRTLSPMKDLLMCEEVEEQIATENNAVRALIGAGGCIKCIYMPEEYRTVVVHCSVKQAPNMPKEVVSAYFEQFGKIRNCMKSRYNPKFPSIWGNVMYDTTESAVKAVSASSGNPDISARPSVRASTRSRDEFRTKITWCRRESRGFGFVELVNVEDMPIVTRCSSLMVGGSPARVTPAKNNPNQVYVGKFNRYVTEDVLRQSVSDASGLHPKNDLGKINIARNKVTTSPDMLDTLKRRLHRQIEQYTTKGRYTLELKSPNDWDVNYTAFVSFKDPEEGYTACKEMNSNHDFMINGETILMKADLKSSIYVYKRIYDKSGEEIQECVKSLEDANPNLKIKMKELRNGNFIMDLHTDCAEDLARSKGIIHEIVKGDTIDCLMTPVLKNLFTWNGRQKLEAIMNQTDTVIITDNRVMTVSVHGLRTNRQKALIEINKYLEELSLGGMKQINLKGADKPPGVMKRVMEKFGSDLAKLATQTQLVSVEIEQRYHRMKMIGTDEALQRASDIIDSIVKKLLDSEAKLSEVEQPDCMICFCPIQDEELYRLECCGHPYCKDCIKRQVEVSVTGREFPLKCSQQDCDVLWAWRDLSNVFVKGFVSKANLVSSSVSSFVKQNKDLFRYCISPDCPMVYKVSKDGQVFRCPVCEIKVCTTCHIESHDGLTCAMYKSMKEDDGSLALWLKQKPDTRKLCPNCTTPIEKIAGCNKMTCLACKKCICWVCLEFFDDEQGCYGHLQKTHGGFQ